eukprot:TRINITY_DN2351_c0_g1_i1.p1 TRINITY_DN2351_c0_g1~~TRINITY_DN2351_c0_g1_i1.p1  ORF type:complete len:159 (-),score=38.08 TRINITY_DN2351_c0_g1_i1:276-728(-)
MHAGAGGREADISRCYDAFAGKDGAIDTEGIKCVFMALLGFRPTKHEVKLCFKGTSLSSTGTVPRDVFTQHMRNRLALVDQHVELRSMFRALDAACQGFLTLPAVLNAMREACPSVTSARVADMFAEADVDRCGRVTFHQFQLIVLGARQ